MMRLRTAILFPALFFLLACLLFAAYFAKTESIYWASKNEAASVGKELSSNDRKESFEQKHGEKIAAEKKNLGAEEMQRKVLEERLKGEDEKQRSETSEDPTPEQQMRRAGKKEEKVDDTRHFDVLGAARLWDEQVGCEKFRMKHSGIIKNFSRSCPDCFPKSESVQDPSEPGCERMKMRHVKVLVRWPDYFKPNWMDRIHLCRRCGITCQVSWTPHAIYDPDAVMWVSNARPPLSKRRPNTPLRVYLNVEGSVDWGKTVLEWEKGGGGGEGVVKRPRRVKIADITVGTAKETDVQVTMSMVREGRNYFLSPVKSQRTPLFLAISNCERWRTEKVGDLLSRLPLHFHHSIGKCLSNVPGTQWALYQYPSCQLPGFGGDEKKYFWSSAIHCLMSHYKFLISFENQRRNGYVTEKMYHALEAGVVPIYYGAPNVADFVPPDSFIDATSFASLNDLAAEIVRLNKDPVAYMNFFAWKRCGVLGAYERTLALSFDNLPCRVCEKVSAMGGKNLTTEYIYMD